MEDARGSALGLRQHLRPLWHRMRAAWQPVSAFLHFALGVLTIVVRGLRRCFFGALAVVVILAFFGLAPQGKEILSLVLEGADWSRYWFASLLASGAAVALIAWYSSRVLMDFRDLRDAKFHEHDLRAFTKRAEVWLPRILGALCIFPIVFFLADAGVKGYVLNSPLLVVATFAGMAAIDAYHHCVRRRLYGWGFVLCLGFVLIAHDWHAEVPFDREFSWSGVLRSLFMVDFSDNTREFRVATTGTQIVLGVALWLLLDRLSARWLREGSQEALTRHMRPYALASNLGLGVVSLGLWLWIFWPDLLPRTWWAIPAVLASAVLVVSFFIHRRDWFARMFINPSSVTERSDAAGASGPPEIRIAGVTKTLLLVSAVAGLVVLMLAGWYPIGVGQFLGTPALLLLALAIWIVFGGVVLTVVPKAYRYPALGLIVILAAALNMLGEAPIPVSTLPDRLPRVAVAGRDPMPIPVVDALQAWLKGRDGVKTGPIYLVAAAGGGIRAAFLTASYLAAADDLSNGDFGQRVFAISGVSGGSLGAATYARLVGPTYADVPVAKCRLQPQETRQLDARQAAVLCALGADFLSPTVATFLFPDLLRDIWVPAFVQHYAPEVVRQILFTTDRGRTLESAWSRQMNELRAGAFAGKFTDYIATLRQPSAGGRSPGVHLILNATRVQSGQRVVASTLTWPIESGIRLVSTEGPDATLGTANLSFVGAVHNSARFTYVSPAGAYYRIEDGQPKLAGQLADGGYFDNSGILSLLEIIQELRTKDADPTIKDVLDRLRVIVITNDGKEATICEQDKPADVAEEVQILAPVATFFATRPARAELSKAQLHRVLGQLGDAREPCNGDMERARLVEVSLNDRLVNAFLNDHAPADPSACVPKPRTYSAATPRKGAGEEPQVAEAQKQVAARALEAPLGWTLSAATTDWLTAYAWRAACRLQVQLASTVPLTAAPPGR